jgi:hypothetical protein
MLNSYISVQYLFFLSPEHFNVLTYLPFLKWNLLQVKEVKQYRFLMGLNMFLVIRHKQM